jgi:tetratricopeptide (TPR) repeat protein
MRWSCLAVFLLLAGAQWSPAQDLRAANPPSPSAAVAPAKDVAPLTPESRADIFMARKMYREAIDLYKSVQPPSAVILNKTGIAYHQMGELETAKKFYEKAIKADRSYPEAVNNLGTIYYAQKSYRRAITQYKRALKLSPESASMYSNLGTAWFARKKYADAATCYEQALALDPMVFERRSSQGSLLQERNVEERAKFHYYLSKTYAKKGMVDLAIQSMRKSIENGFKEREKFLKEDDFASIRTHPDFEILMKMESRVL